MKSARSLFKGLKILFACVVCVFMAASGPASAQSISGQVVAADTGAALEGYYVNVIDPDWSTVYTITDANGEFTVPDGVHSTAPLPADTDLRVSAEPPEPNTPYIKQFYNQKNPGQTPDAIVLSAGETRADVDFRLSPAPNNSVSGAVKNTDLVGISQYDQQNLSIMIESRSLDYYVSLPVNPDGTYTVQYLPPASDYHAYVWIDNLDGCSLAFLYSLPAGKTVGVDPPTDSAIYEPNATPLTIGPTTVFSNIDIIIDPFQPRKIQGTVAAADTGDPLEGYGVTILGEETGYESYPGTDASGTYTACAVPPDGSIVVFVYPPDGGLYEGEHYNDKPDMETADRISTLSGSQPSINFQLKRAPANSISGQVRDKGGNPLSGVTVSFYAESDDLWKHVDTGPDGSYVMTGLTPAPDYRVSAYYGVNGGFYDFYHFDSTRSVLDFNRARVFEVTETTTLNGIDIIVGEQGGAISGTVTDADGALLSGVQVNAWSESRQTGGDATTDGSGAYRIWGLDEAATDYVVSVQDDRYINQWYNNSVSFDGATLVQPGQTGIDFRLTSGATLSGTVSDNSENPVSDAYVTAWSPSSKAYGEGTTGDAGDYAIPNLPPKKDYIVSVVHPAYQRQWYNGKSREEDADSVDLSNGNRTANFFLSKGAVISGTIYLSDRSTPAGAGVYVEAYSESNGTGNSAETGADGAFEIVGLNPDIPDYILMVYSPERPVVYFNTLSPDGIVYARQRATGIDPSSGLEMVIPGGVSISGSVTINGAPAAGVRVEASATEIDVELGEIDYGWGEAFTTGAIVGGANYTINGIRPGLASVPVTYTVTLYLPPELARYAGQQTTVVIGNQDVTDVDFALDEVPGRTISGVVNGLPAGEVAYVNAWSEAASSGNGVQVVGAEAGGPVAYKIISLIPADDYMVELYSDNFPRIVYQNKFGWMPFDEVDLSDAGRNDVHFTLPAQSTLGTISGAVTFPAGATPGQSVRVRAISASTGVEQEVEVFLGSDGPTSSYVMKGLLRASDYRVSLDTSLYKRQYYDGAASEIDATLVDISDGGETGVDFVLRTGASISGHVATNQTGATRLWVTAWSNSLGAGGDAPMGADGAYIVRGLEPAHDYIVGVSDWQTGLGSYYYSENGTVRSEILATPVSTETGNRDNIDIALSSGQTISGTVRSMDGERLPNIWVNAWSERQAAGNGAYTGADGAYAIRGLPDGRYEVAAQPEWSDGYIEKVKADVLAGSVGVDFSLPRQQGAHRLSGTVTDGQNGVGGVTVQLWTEAGALAGWAVTDISGAWAMDGVATDAYRLTVEPPPTTNLAFTSQDVPLVNDDRVLPSIALGQGISIGGVVMNSDGDPVKGAKIHAVSMQRDYWGETATNSAGRYSFRAIPSAGDYLVSAVRDGYATEEARATSGGSETINFTLYPSGAIYGVVRGADGAPLSDVPVTAYSAARKNEPQFSGSARTSLDGWYRIDGLRSTGPDGGDIVDYVVEVSAFTRYTETGDPNRYLGAIQTGRRPGNQVDLSVPRATDSSVEISGTVNNPAALGGDYVAVDLVAGGGESGRFDQHQVMGPGGGFRFRGLQAGVDYFLGFGVYTGENEIPIRYQWAGPLGTAIADDPVIHQPPAGASVYAAGDTGIGFSFDPNVRRRSIRADAAGPGPVRNLRIDAAGLTATGNPSVLQARANPQDLIRTPGAAVSNSPTVTVTWLPSADGADERYYYTFDEDADHEINKRNAPTPSVATRKATSQDLSGDYNQHHFHIAVEDDRGRIGDTLTLSFVIDTIAPRNVTVRARSDAEATNPSVVTLELGGSGATEIYISNTGFGQGGQWETYAPTRQWSIAGETGDATIYVQFRDEAKNTANAFVNVAADSPLRRAIAALQVLTGVAVEAVDADENGRVGLSDAILLLQQAAGIR